MVATGAGGVCRFDVESSPFLRDNGPLMCLSNWALIIQINSPGFLPEYQAFKLTIPLKSGRCEHVHCPSPNIDVHAYKSCMCTESPYPMLCT